MPKAPVFYGCFFSFNKKMKKQLTDGIIFAIIVLFMQGEVSERFKELVLKTSDSKEPWVRIPPSPPNFVSCKASLPPCLAGKAAQLNKNGEVPK